MAFDASPIRPPIGGVGRYATELAFALAAIDGELAADPSSGTATASAQSGRPELVLLTNRPGATARMLEERSQAERRLASMGAAQYGRDERAADDDPQGPGKFALISGALRRPTLAWLQLEVPRLVRTCGATVAHFTTGRAPIGLGLPFVLTVHDLTALTHPGFYRRRERWMVRPWLIESLRRATQIIAVSDHTAGEIAAVFPWLEPRVRVIPEAPSPILARAPDPLGIATLARELRGGEMESSSDHPLAHPAPGGTGWVSGRPIWLCVASFTTRKGLAVLMEAADRAGRRLAERSVRPTLVIVGTAASGRGSEAPTSPAAKSIKQVWPGHVSDADLPTFYAASDLVVVPSLHEGFGLVALEAMALGRPVLATTAGALPEVLGDAGALVPAGDVDALANALVELTLSPVRRAQLAELGRRRAAMFTWSRAAQETAAVYALAAAAHGFSR